MIPAMMTQTDGSTTCTDVGTWKPGCTTVNTDTAVAMNDDVSLNDSCNDDAD